ncbi:hypothetical protein N7281_02995 [Rickettsia hoogstraalii]|uniref:hypothetical protein n=1 Tax=Rickettsia hoogstraalii TaxID=467174 RepID=UPI00225167FE|nr:hypothetical protein [Rickettsia hoogstraalii]MCX4083842.1 hypothetical protein [Rickettsia hoogstraalii]
MSIEDKTKFNKVGKQISDSEHQATHNVLNTPKRQQGEVNKPYQDFTPFSESNPKQELKRTHQGYASSIETPAPQTKPISKSSTSNTTLTKTIVTKNLNVASKNPINAIAEKLINQFKGNKPIHKTKQPPTSSA